MTSPGPASTLRFAARFRCIGSACEDNCCAHPWRVRVDKADYVRLERAYAGSAAQRELFARGCARDPDARADAPEYAVLQRTRAGACVFLTADRLCAVHAAHGPGALPKTCATYPRAVIRIGRHLAQGAVLSCPEAARLCFLAEDAARLDALDPQPLRGLRVRHDLPGMADAADARRFLTVRDAFVNLFTRNDVTIAGRLYAAAHLARRLDADRATGVDATIASGTAASTVRACDAECRAARVTGTLPFILVQHLLIALPREPATARLTALVDAIYTPFLDPSPDGSGAGLRALPLWEAYRRHRQEWERAAAARIDRFVAHYAANYWVVDPQTASPDLLTHVLRLLTRVAAFRFLLFNHPALGGDAGGEALDRAAVDAVYAFTRAVEHGAGTRELLSGVMRECGVTGLRAVAELVRF